MTSAHHPCHFAQIDLHQLFLGVEVGRGSFGVVHTAKYIGQDVAVKRLEGVEAAAVLAEAAPLFDICNEFIVRIHGVCTNPLARDAAGKEVGLALVIQLANCGSVLELLRDPDRKKALCKRNRWLLFLSQAAFGISYLHSKSILHRDIKAGNLLVSESLKPLVADFGLACRESAGTVTQGTYNYMAPERLRGGVATREADMYSFGLVMWFVASAAEIPNHTAEPWEGEIFQDVQQMVLSGERPDWLGKVKKLDSLQRFRQVVSPISFGTLLSAPLKASCHVGAHYKVVIYIRGIACVAPTT